MEKNKIEKRLKALRARMEQEQLDAYLVLSGDFHASEYVGDYFKCRAYISGFTGSAGSVAITQKEAGLWTDGRYFLQADEQLSGSGITLYRMGEEGVPTLADWLAGQMPERGTLGVDGRTLTVSAGRRLSEKLAAKQASIRTDVDFVGEIWKDRPAMPCTRAWELALCYAGKTRAEKIADIKKKLAEKKAQLTVISSLDDIAWTLNVRGSDVACTPVVLSYLVVTKTRVLWFVQQDACTVQLEEALVKDGVEVCAYGALDERLAGLTADQTVFIDPDKTSMALYALLAQAKEIIEDRDVTQLPKAVKNKAEVENERIAHQKDGVACTKFLYWLKHAVGSEKITEITAAKKLEEFRMAQEHYLEPSFDTIVGYGAHGAIVHYSATPKTDWPLAPQGFVLIDSGGHYLEGTTDITRTVSLGVLTPEQRHHYTLVLKGNLKLAAAVFRYGCAGINFDYLARESLWQEGLDYNHGTGHGVGYLLSVHESPNSFRYRVSAARDECVRLEEGMITSDEPGLYIDGQYGIRLENLLVCQKREKNAYGQFMGFETLTLVPFDRDAIVNEELTAQEKKLLNAYHARVWESLEGHLTDAERAWLFTQTAPF